MHPATAATDTRGSGEPTLGAILRRAAHVQLPSRFSLVLQLCAPFAVQFWMWGRYRTAGCLVVASAFGLWALAQQRIEGYADADVGEYPPGSRALLGWRMVRRTGATIGT